MIKTTAIPGARPALLALALVLLITQALPAAPQPESGDKAGGNYGLLVSPRSVKLGDTVHVLAVSESAVESGRLEVKGPAGDVRLSAIRNGGGPPFWRSAEFAAETSGPYTVSLVRKKTVLASREVKLAPPGSGRPKAGPGWVDEKEWDRTAENLYASWVEALFHEDDEHSSWKALHEVTQDPHKNLLHNHLGLGEDDPSGENAVSMMPDCADAPYFLRAYFAWKMRLPFGFRQCSRGTLSKPPRCPDWFTNVSQVWTSGETRAFNHFLVRVMNIIHSGTARTLLEDEESDYYPVPLTRDTLRPGLVFADPYGHTLILVRWQAQTEDQPGQLLAADAQPDGTIGLRRFWRGNFLFNTKGVIGNPGFKAFRPIRKERGRLRPLTNDELQGSSDFVPFSLQQKSMDVEAFYDTMDRLINPAPLDPATALRELFTAFHEQLLTRILSVSNAEKYMASHPGAVVPMPAGTAAVFQDLGQWEDYSTPNRDMRLLIAMDVLLGFPDRVVRSPQLYVLSKRKTPEQVKQELEALLGRWSREAAITYTRSNGKPQVLTVEDILKRGEALEMAYNPNDCIEIRWAAPEGSAERASCGRRAPIAQQERMRTLRTWFHKRLRPPT